jgi:hypothetical protein
MADRAHSSGYSTRSSSNRPQSIDRATSAPLVRCAMGSPTVQVISWDVKRIHGGPANDSAGSSVVYRFRGADATEQRRWSGS